MDWIEEMHEDGFVDTSRLTVIVWQHLPYDIERLEITLI
jgi:hypothetical protein